MLVINNLNCYWVGLVERVGRSLVLDRRFCAALWGLLFFRCHADLPLDAMRRACCVQSCRTGVLVYLVFSCFDSLRPCPCLCVLFILAGYSPPRAVDHSDFDASLPSSLWVTRGPLVLLDMMIFVLSMVGAVNVCCLDVGGLGHVLLLYVCDWSCRGWRLFGLFYLGLASIFVALRLRRIFIVVLNLLVRGLCISSVVCCVFCSFLFLFVLFLILVLFYHVTSVS